MAKERLIPWRKDVSFWKTGFPPEKVWQLTKIVILILFLLIIRQALIMGLK